MKKSNADLFHGEGNQTAKLPSNIAKGTKVANTNPYAKKRNTPIVKDKKVQRGWNN